MPVPVEPSFVAFRLSDGTVVRLSPGAIIGRSSTADLRIPDPNVSEAHALVSLRGRSLRLLALRRWFEVGGQRLSQVELVQGQSVRLAPDVTLEVAEVQAASRILALVGVGEDAVELSAPVYALLRGENGLVAEPRFEPTALAHVFSSTDGWGVRTADGTTLDLADGTVFEVDGEEVEAVAIELQVGNSTLTSAPSPPMRIVTRHDTVHLHPSGRPSVVLTGIPSRIVSELAAMGAPVSWVVVAKEIWNHDDERLLRQNWDRNMRSLRARLRAFGIREDLVRPDGHGNTELLLLPGDTLEDEG